MYIYAYIHFCFDFSFVLVYMFTDTYIYIHTAAYIYVRRVDQAASFTCIHVSSTSCMCHTAGCLHPEYQGFFASPAQYIKWYNKHGPLGSDPTHPTVAVLLYRKHVITEQLYIGQLISCMEAQGVRPIPIFINGIEAHTVVGALSLPTTLPPFPPPPHSPCHYHYSPPPSPSR